MTDAVERDRPLRILLLHAQYINVGGEESVLASESALLEKHGHEVIRHVVQNSEYAATNRLLAGARMIWNQGEHRRIRDIVRRVRPDIAHFHNFFPGISPAGHYAVKAERVPVVQSLHNFRLYCLNSFCFRDGGACEDCLGKLIPWPGVRHSCHPRGRGVSLAVATMLVTHRVARTWKRTVDLFLCHMSEFSAKKLVEAGIPGDRIVVKPNFIDPDPGIRSGGGGYALFVGRLSPEKGIETLLRAWRSVPHEIPLKIIGDGPLSTLVDRASHEMDNVEWLGRQPYEEVIELMGNADALVFPSEWYEGVPRTLIESYAVGTPVIGSDIGGVPEMITHESTGLLFPPGDSAALATAARRMLSAAANLPRFRMAARARFEDRYTAPNNYQQLISAYHRAMNSKR